MRQIRTRKYVLRYTPFIEQAHREKNNLWLYVKLETLRTARDRLRQVATPVNVNVLGFGTFSFKDMQITTQLTNFDEGRIWGIEITSRTRSEGKSLARSIGLLDKDEVIPWERLY